MIDHLVVAARRLDDGVPWLAERLGVEPAGHGRHERYGTHNALWALGGRTYLELIAVDPDMPHPGRPRWFGLDSPAVQRHVAERPRLVHWVAAVDAIRSRWRGEHGPARRLARDALSWTVTVPDDGSLPGDGSGTWPTLIAWDDTHPTDALEDADLALERLVLSSPRPDALRDRLLDLGRGDPGVRVVVAPGPGALRAELRTSQGPVLLD